MQHVAFESFGVRIRVTADSPEVLERIPALLPPDSQPCQPSEAEESFGVLADMNGMYEFTRGGSPVTSGLDLDFAMMLLDNQLRIYIGWHATNRIFVHAGVVAHEGRAIVLPGLSFAGKTTLVLALVHAGAVYYSDEFAVFDERGLIHPYTKPLSVRDHEQVQSDQEVKALGGLVGEDPLPVGTVVVTHYVVGGRWSPKRISRGAGALALLANAVTVRHRPDEATRYIVRALEHAVVFESERGEASEMADRLLECALA